MAKKIAAIALIILLAVILAGPAYCDDALKKLGRGVCNIGTCILELPEQVSRVNNEEGAAAAITFGFIKGLGMLCVRAAVGVYEVATFPIPLPRYYKPILKDPEFFFEEKNW